MVAAADIARITATSVATTLEFMAARRERDEAFLAEKLRPRTRERSDVETAIAEERVRADAFRAATEQRLRRDLPLMLAIPNPAEREAAVRGLLGRERRYQEQRAQAMVARAVAAVDRQVLRRESPSGAFWKLDPSVKEHTAGCLVMGGRFWPWPVLDRVHPPRHGGCPCRLVGYAAAVAAKLMKPGDVLDLAAAMRVAAGVVMEAEEAEALAAELDRDALRELLVAAGMVDAVEFDAVMGAAS